MKVDAKYPSWALVIVLEMKISLLNLKKKKKKDNFNHFTTQASFNAKDLKDNSIQSLNEAK